LLAGSQRIAIQTFALDKQIPCEGAELYRSIARPPPPSRSEISDIDDDHSSSHLTQTLSGFDEDIYYELDSKSLMHVPGHTDVILAGLKSFRLDVDEARAFRWASRYFLACILQGHGKISLANATRLSAAKIFERMLESETRCPCAFPRQTCIPSTRSCFILSGLNLMATVLNAHGRVDMLRTFLLDSRRSIVKYFGMKDHPLSAPYSYLLSLMDDDDHPMDDELWERTLSSSHTIIRQVWNGGPNAVVSHFYWASHNLKRKHYAHAVKQLQLCHRDAATLFGEHHIITINCLSTIARAHFEQSMYYEAWKLWSDTVRQSQAALGSEHPFCYTLMEQVGGAHLKLGDLASAEAVFQEVVDGRKKSLGLHHVHTLGAAHTLAVILSQQGKQTEG
jgi:hypothetical protein